MRSLNQITFTAVIGEPSSGFGISLLGYDCNDRKMSFVVVHNAGEQRVRIGDGQGEENSIVFDSNDSQFVSDIHPQSNPP